MHIVRLAKIKMMVYTVHVLPVLLYRSQCRTMSNKDKRKVACLGGEVERTQMYHIWRKFVNKFYSFIQKTVGYFLRWQSVYINTGPINIVNHKNTPKLFPKYITYDQLLQDRLICQFVCFYASQWTAKFSTFLERPDEHRTRSWTEAVWTSFLICSTSIIFL